MADVTGPSVVNNSATTTTASGANASQNLLSMLTSLTSALQSLGGGSGLGELGLGSGLGALDATEFSPQGSFLMDMDAAGNSDLNEANADFAAAGSGQTSLFNTVEGLGSGSGGPFVSDAYALLGLPQLANGDLTSALSMGEDPTSLTALMSNSTGYTSAAQALSSIESLLSTQYGNSTGMSSMGGLSALSALLGSETTMGGTSTTNESSYISQLMEMEELQQLENPEEQSSSLSGSGSGGVQESSQVAKNIYDPSGLSGGGSNSGAGSGATSA